MFSPQPIGYVRSPYKRSQEIPKGFGAKHEAEGVLELLPEFETGLTDIEGFSHLSSRALRPAKSHENCSEPKHNPRWLGAARLIQQWRS